MPAILITADQMLKMAGRMAGEDISLNKHNNMKLIIGLIFTCIGYTVAGQDTTALLLSKEKEMFSAVCNGDKPAAEKLFAPDYVTINADGRMQSRVETMNEFGKFKGSTFRLSDQQIRRYGITAIITGKAQFYIKSIQVAAVHYTEIWVAGANGWQFAGWQGTMTGGPSWYPIIGTAVLVVLIFAVWNWVRKKIAGKKSL